MEKPKTDILFRQGLVIKVNDEDDPLFYVFDYQYRPLTMEFQHFHDFYEIYVLLDDHAAHIIEGEYFNLQRYDMVLLKPSCLHKIIYPEGEGIKARLIISFRMPGTPGLERQDKRILSPFEAPQPIFRFTGDIHEKIVGYLNEIFILGTERPPEYELMIHGTFKKFLWTIFRYCRENSYTRQDITDSITQKIYDITGFIHGHYDRDISLSSLAGRFYVSPSYLSRQFKRVTGSSFVTYLQMVRIRNAQQMLRYSSKRIKDIADQCGFASFSQFNRVFNKICGMTPSAFRADSEDRSQLLIKSLNPERNAPATPPRIKQPGQTG